MFQLPVYIFNKNLVVDVYQQCYELYTANPRSQAKSKLTSEKWMLLQFWKIDASITLANGFLTKRLYIEELKVHENGYN